MSPDHLTIEEGRRLLVPAVVVAQAWRDARRQVQLGRFLHGRKIIPVGLELAKAAGVLSAPPGGRTPAAIMKLGAEAGQAGALLDTAGLLPSVRSLIRRPFWVAT